MAFQKSKSWKETGQRLNMRLSIHALRGFLVAMLLMSASSCIPLMIAAGGAVGGYAISRDTFEGVTAKSQDEIWDATQRVMSIMGTVTENDRHSGEIIGTVNGANVTVSLLAVNLSTTKIRIKARKGIFPRVGIAQEVYTKIMNQLEQ